MPQTHKEGEPGHVKNQPVSDDTLLKIAKEIAIKFIEVGRLTPATFDQVFRDILATLKESSQS